jgi:serine/threonine protein kinase
LYCDDYLYLLFVVCYVNRELPPHPNVVQVFGVSLDGNQPVIVMEYCAGGTHSERERERKREHNKEKERVFSCPLTHNVKEKCIFSY